MPVMSRWRLAIHSTRCRFATWLDSGVRLTKIKTAIALVALSLSASPGKASTCPVPGEPGQWIADYCLAQTQTDDIVAAGPCIDGETTRVRRLSSCAVKMRYKIRLCQSLLATGARTGSLAACVSDPAFAGKIVRDKATDQSSSFHPTRRQ